MEPDDVHWQHYLDLLTIMDYIFAPGTDGRRRMQNMLLKHGLRTYNTYILRHHGGHH